MTVYVLHDNTIVVDTLLDFLGNLGYEAESAHSVEALLGVLEARGRPTNLVLAKLEAIGPDRIAVLCELHRWHPEAAVVLITRPGRGLPAREAAACGVYAYLREPIELNELELMLARFTETNPARC